MQAPTTWRPLALIPSLLLALGLGLSIGWPAAQGQERERPCEDPAWARALTRALEAEREAKPRYQRLTQGKRTLVFDTRSGRSYELQDDKLVRIEDPVAGTVTKRRVELIDESIGGVIRTR